jgi:uncharacterized protein (DUF1778 family)
MVERAATLSGMSVDDFASAALLEKSQEVFLSILDSPADPTARLSSASQRFEQAVTSGDLGV